MKRAVVDPSVLVSAFVGSPAAGPGQLVAAWRDHRFVALAQIARVDAIVSLDRDLLDAGLDRIAVVDPAQFLSSL